MLDAVKPPYSSIEPSTGRAWQRFRAAWRRTAMPGGVPPTAAGIVTSAIDALGIPSWAAGQVSPDSVCPARAIRERSEPSNLRIVDLCWPRLAVEYAGQTAPIAAAIRAAPKAVA
jgi:hypothetical protein